MTSAPLRIDDQIISIDKGDMFEGTLSQWENTFGGLSALSDQEAVAYIREWAGDNGYFFSIRRA